MIDVKGAFLKDRFNKNNEELLLEVPQWFRWVYDKLGDEVKRAKEREQNARNDGK